MFRSNQRSAAGAWVGFVIAAALVLVAVLATPTSVRAAPLTVINPSFELPDIAGGTFSGNTSNGPVGWGWSAYYIGPARPSRFFGVWDATGTPSFVAVPHGRQVGVVFLDDALGLEAGIRQTLADTLQPFTEYSLSVGVGNFAPSPGGDPWNFAGFPGYRVELLAGNAVLALDNNSLNPGEGVFQTATVNFTTGAAHANMGQALTIRLINLNGPGVEVNFDNVSLNALAVPEPSSFALLALGALLLVWHRRSKAAR